VSAAAKSSPTRVFLDTNVLFSGMHTPDGPAGSILEHLVLGRISAVICQQVLDELVRVFNRKLPGMLFALREFLINARIEIDRDSDPEDAAQWSGLVPEEDCIILAAAVAAEPDYFVTGDRHFLGNIEVEEACGLIICSPS
jgi:putative PIN family toxin of toxin-antitoxin system